MDRFERNLAFGEVSPEVAQGFVEVFANGLEFFKEESALMLLCIDDFELVPHLSGVRKLFHFLSHYFKRL